MDRDNVESYSFLALFVCVGVLVFFVFAPFLQILVLAAVFAALFHRPYEALARRLHGWNNLAALIVVALVLIFCIVPLFFLGLQIFREAQNFYVGAQGNGVQYLQTIQTFIENPIRYVFPEFSFDLSASIGNVFAFISGNLASIVYQTFYVTLETFLMLLAFFFFLRDGNALLAQVEETSPFGKEKTRAILHDSYLTIRSIVRGTLVVALVRWLLISVGFYFFQIPNAILLGSIGGIIGAIPGLGTPFAFIPAIIYLYLQGNVLGAVTLTLFGLFVIAIVDNVLTPYFFGKGLPVPSIFVLFSILGGVIFFGPLGFILGPLVLSIFVSVVHIYSLMATPSVSRK
ncbi:MAG: AI-2E family transporter [Candidatus Pacebacteria bacterium]|nr:AI-2E family transporter [Candidatus Paceibacterota bacterium]